MSAPVLSDVKKFCLCDRKIAQPKVINYETIARQKPWDCVHLLCFETERAPYVTVRIRIDRSYAEPIVSSNNFSFFRFSNNSHFIFPHFSRHCLSAYAIQFGQLDNPNWYMLFLSSIHENRSTWLERISVVFSQNRWEHECIKKTPICRHKTESNRM